MDLFYIDVSDDCKVDGVNDINDWYAAYINVPNTCSQMEVIKQLQADGADFVFLYSAADDYSKLNSRAIHIPVFLMNSKNRDVGPFMAMAASSATREKMEHPENKAEKLLRNTPIARLFISLKHKVSKNDHAELTFVYSPANIRSFDFIDSIAPVYSQMKDYLKFEPVLAVYKRKNPQITKSKNCYLKTYYCAADPDGAGPFNGADVVIASLRQKCIYQDDKSKWFTYMKYFSANCKNEFSDKCHESCLSNSGTSKESVETCIARSALGAEDNSILSSDYSKMQTLLHDMTYPVLLINGNTYRVASTHQGPLRLQSNWKGYL